MLVIVETTLGLRSNLESLDLDNAGLDYNEKDIRVDGYLCIHQSPIYAVGYYPRG